MMPTQSGKRGSRFDPSSDTSQSDQWPGYANIATKRLGVYANAIATFSGTPGSHSEEHSCPGGGSMEYRSSASIVLFVVFCLPECATAQTATLSGTVTDSTAAVIPQTKVTTRNSATDESRGTETDSSGRYRIASLTPGIYDVLIEKQGFKALLYSQIELSVGQVLNLNPVLSPSAAREMVTVQGENVAPIDLNDAQVGNLINSEQVQDLPLILRDPYQLTLLSPGTIQGTSILHGLSVNGSRERNNN